MLDRRPSDAVDSVDEALNGRLGVCSYCTFAFCIECGKAWHGVAGCNNVFQQWKNGSKAEREALVKRFGAAVFERLESEAWLSEHTHKCPRCRANIQKNGGCNHMTCVHCKYEFCWVCHRGYQPGHYNNSSCRQFDDSYFDDLGVAREDYYRLFT